MDLEHLWSSLADRYRLERELGRGGMATVYLVRDLWHGRPVALKIMHPELAAGLGSRRFLREIQLAARLDHPHILPVYHSGEAAGQIAGALEYAHARDVPHRDIKPENILLAGGYARLTDFGVARAVEAGAEPLTRVGFAVGTPSYMSPEQASGEKVDPRPCRPLAWARRPRREKERRAHLKSA